MVRQVGRPNVGFCEVSADVIFSLEASLKDSMNSGESHEVEIADVRFPFAVSLLKNEYSYYSSSIFREIK